MNIEQFAALKPGDRIENAMTRSKGEVSRRGEAGVYVRWDGNPMEFTYVVNSTIWMHWEMAE